MDFLADLNHQQRQAVEAADGPLMIAAGPGTGKTKTLACRIAYLIASGRAQPDQILALTFTNKAAKEMGERVAGLLDTAQPLPRIATFHALSYELLRQQTAQPLTFIAESDRLAIIAGLRKKASLKDLSTRELAARISRAKAAVTSSDPSLANLVATYTQTLRGQNLYDFDDLLLQAHDLLQQDVSLRKQLQNQYRYVMVDEFQDTNEVQYALLHLLNATGNVMVIGDPRQSIYAFRGARDAIFAQFEADFSNCQTITLTQNYRSAPEVVALGNAIFPDATPLHAHQQAPGHVQAVQVLNEYSEAAWIIETIEQALGGTDFLRSHAVAGQSDNPRHCFGDFAVLYRSHRTALALRRALADSGLPYQVAGEGTPYDQPVIQRIIEVLRRLGSPSTPLPQGFNEAQFDALARSLPSALLSEVASEVVAKLKLDQEKPALKRDLQHFIGTLVRFDQQGVAAFLAYYDSIAQQQFYDPSADAVSLMTIHAAKGLEFTHVFLIGVEEGLLPHKQADNDEERRLFYVAATRAKQRLDLLYTKNRATRPSKLSCFVHNLSTTRVPRLTDSNMAAHLKRVERRRQKNRQTSLL